MSDLVESLGQRVQQQAPQKLHVGQRASATVVGGEEDRVRVAAHDTRVRDTDAMGIATEVAEDLVGATERRLDVYGFSSIRLKAMSSAGAEFGPIGIELNLLYITALLALALSEPSRWSIDRWRANSATPRQ